MKDHLVRVVIGLTLLSLISSLGLAAGVDKVQKKYSESEKAAYLTDEQIDFIRPGLNLKINSITLGSNLKYVVQFSIQDANNQPLDRDGILSPGTVSTSFVLSRINKGDTQYTPITTRTGTNATTGIKYVYAGTDQGGTYKKISDGVYEYSFNTALAADYPKDVTYTLGMQSSRNLTAWGLSTYVVNLVQSWVPDGSAVKTIRDVVATDNCNQCHDPLNAHGSRREVKYCILCHNPNGNMNPAIGETIDFKVFIHKLHRGKNLAAVLAGGKYGITSPTSGNLTDFSDVGFPQDLRNCDICHKNATQANNWFNVPTRDACGSCHDDIVWASGKNHLGGVAISDKFCANCHFPQGETEYDASVKGAHTNPFDSKQLINPVFEIVNVTGAIPGGKPKVDFRIKDKTGKVIAYKDFTRLALTIAGPTTDYSFQLSEQPTVAQVTTTGDVNSYTFTGTLPGNAAGTFSFGMEGYINTTLNPGTTKSTVFRDRGNSLFKNIAVTDAKPVDRRAVVADAKCLVCHDTWSVHGNNRTNAQYCVTCHNPTATDVARRPATDKPEETIDFRTMIHKIHRGASLDRGLIIYGFGGSKNDFSDIGFPGDLRNCEKCHLTGTQNVPLKDGLLSVSTKRDFFTPTPPESAACLACHDSKSAAAHAYVNIAAFGEACSVCHGTAGDFSVAKAHAR